VTDFRELCYELVRAMDSYPLRPKAHRDLCNKVRLALAEHDRCSTEDADLDPVFARYLQIAERYN
jgi:hypothetical protein